MSDSSFIAFDDRRFASNEIGVNRVAADGRLLVNLGSVRVYLDLDAAERLTGMLLDALAETAEGDCTLMRPAPEDGESHPEDPDADRDRRIADETGAL